MEISLHIFAFNILVDRYCIGRFKTIRVMVRIDRVVSAHAEQRYRGSRFKSCLL